LNANQISEKLKQIENVETVSPTTFTNSIIIGEQSVNYSILISKDRKPKTKNQISISLGEKLAEKIGAKVGDEIELVTLKNQTEPKRSNVFVSEIFSTGIYDYDSTWIYASAEDFALINDEKVFAPTILSVSVRDIYKTNETTEKIKAIFDGTFQIIDWQKANQPLFAALSLERKVSLVVISLIIFIAALNITTTLALLVNERRFDIAILRTCGAKGKTLIAIFLFEGILIGAIGIIFGLVFGLLICFLGNYFRLVSLPEQVYSLSYIPFHVEFSNVFFIVLVALSICLSATVYPAFRASRIKPLDNLRTM
jgi:lipoprotein-releasing system permease protein